MESGRAGSEIKETSLGSATGVFSEVPKLAQPETKMDKTHAETTIRAEIGDLSKFLGGAF